MEPRGSETELLEIGAIPAGILDGLKARILLSLCLAADPAGENVATAFQALGMAAVPGTGVPTPCDTTPYTADASVATE